MSNEKSDSTMAYNEGWRKGAAAGKRKALEAVHAILDEKGMSNLKEAMPKIPAARVVNRRTVLDKKAKLEEQLEKLNAKLETLPENEEEEEEEEEEEV